MNDINPVELVRAANDNDGGFGGGNGWWIIWLFFLVFWGNNGWGGNRGGGAGSAGGDVLYPWMNSAETIMNGFSNVQNALCSGFSNTTAAITNGFSNAETAATARQMANMQQMFGLSQQLAECCCENRLATANLGAEIAREACADRAAVSDGVRDILANQIAVSQRQIDNQNEWGQRLLDRFTQYEMAQKDDIIAQLRSQVSGLQLAASQIAQNGMIINGVYDQLSKCPVGTVPVSGEQPIFTCNNNTGCGCGNGF